MNFQRDIILGLVALAVVVFIGWRLYDAGKDSAKPAIEAQADHAATAGLETRGARDSAQRVDVVVTQARAADAAVIDLSAQALASEDAHAPLDPDRADRLRHHDGELCGIAPTLAGCAVAPD